MFLKNSRRQVKDFNQKRQFVTSSIIVASRDSNRKGDRKNYAKPFFYMSSTFSITNVVKKTAL